MQEPRSLARTEIAEKKANLQQSHIGEILEVVLLYCDIHEANI